MLYNVQLGTRRYPSLGKAVGSGRRTVAVELGRKWVRITCPNTLRTETILRSVWDEAVAPTVTPAKVKATRIKATGLQNIEAKVAGLRFQLETKVPPVTPAEIEKAVTQRRKSLKKVLQRVVDSARAD